MFQKNTFSFQNLLFFEISGSIFNLSFRFKFIAIENGVTYFVVKQIVQLVSDL